MKLRLCFTAQIRIHIMCLAFLGALSPPLQAYPARSCDFTSYSLEELMEMELVSAARRPQTAHESAAAAYIITREDIRRSGAVNLPEALRMAPGIQVMRSDPGDFAVTSRGFLGEWATKLLVLIDGRSIYSPLMSGVLWEYDDMLLENIERIEVIRGPGATLWGANAVNGVINIITKHARDTQGGMAVSTFSNSEGYDGLRYGAKIKEGLYLRAYGKYANFAGVTNNKQQAEPRQVRGGARLDWDMTAADRLLVTADYFDGWEKTFASRTVLLPPPVQASVKDDNNFEGGSALARWEHTFSTTSDMQLQLYYTGYAQSARRTTGYGPARCSSELKKDAARLATYDFDLQHTFAPGGGNSIIWGLNARYSRLYKRNINYFYKLESETETQRLYSAFIQDDIELLPERLRLIIGSKLEYNSYTQLEVQPSIRMLYTPSTMQSFWWAVSKAARTPSTIETKGRVRAAYIDRGSLFPASPPGIGEIQGNKKYGSENLIAYEAGHRVQLVPELSLDTAVFYNVYSDLRTFEPSAPRLKRGYFLIPLSADNRMDGRTYGAEVAATWQVLPQWRLQATYSHIRMNLTPDKNSRDTLSEKDEHLSSPKLATLRSLYSITPALEFDVSLYYTDRIKRLNNPSFTDLTVRLGWRPIKCLMLEVIGYNLIDNKYQGFRDEIYARSLNEVRRAFYGRITLTF